MGGRLAPLGDRRLVGHEEVVDVARYEPGRCGLPRDYVHDVLAVEPPPLAEEVLLAVIVVVLPVREVGR